MTTPSNAKRVKRQRNLTIKFAIPILVGRINSNLGFLIGALIFAWEFLEDHPSDRPE
ncbi:hypothetical protein H6F77_03800 [Microcoleus sp. FACHB-831]|uniref:hypothetical protein n=1 Tax=Microcoleus sp. FACHB-831 TaxID=2692827 RepID=UPI0016897E66|nr:hypothetical protein [Microcoleus sp. FACHB-831]MBD1920240.1 hypothetical protein [Microcoleus sp. FACHB-831]